jgi:hypothetical protein
VGFGAVPPTQILTANLTANADGELLKRGNASSRRGAQNVETTGFARPAASRDKNKQNKKPAPRRVGLRAMMNVKHRETAFGAAGPLPERAGGEGAESQRNQRLTGIGFRSNIVLGLYIYTKNRARAPGILWEFAFPVLTTYRKSRAVDSSAGRSPQNINNGRLKD